MGIHRTTRRCFCCCCSRCCNSRVSLLRCSVIVVVLVVVAAAAVFGSCTGSTAVTSASFMMMMAARQQQQRRVSAFVVAIASARSAPAAVTTSASSSAFKNYNRQRRRQTTITASLFDAVVGSSNDGSDFIDNNRASSSAVLGRIRMNHHRIRTHNNNTNIYNNCNETDARGVAAAAAAASRVEAASSASSFFAPFLFHGNEYGRQLYKSCSMGSSSSSSSRIHQTRQKRARNGTVRLFSTAATTDSLEAAAVAAAAADADSTHTSSSSSSSSGINLIYKELQSVATQLRQHDALYYDNNNNNDDDDDDVTTTMTMTAITPISDEEYDALAAREAALCRAHPELWQTWRDESGWGVLATRYEGRVGSSSSSSWNGRSRSRSSDIAAADYNDNDVDTTTTTSVDTFDAANASATSAQQQQQQQLVMSSHRLKRTHLRPMLSLDNVHNTEQLLAWLERVRKKLLLAAADTAAAATPSGDNDTAAATTTTTITIVTEPKLDGLSLSLRYQRQRENSDSSNDNDTASSSCMSYKLQWASTRGDGRKGTDVTAAVRDMGSVPLEFKISMPSHANAAILQQLVLSDDLEVRGEIVLPQTVFRQLQADQAAAAAAAAVDDNGESKSSNQTSSSTTATSVMSQFSNARNAASGILLRKEQLVEMSNSSSCSALLTESQELRSKLRFYAYDVVMVTSDDDGDDRFSNNNSTTARLATTDGAAHFQTRELLHALIGFAVPEPAITTTLTLKTMNSNAASSLETTVTNHSDTQLLLRWTDADIPDMMQYYEALRAYREEGKIAEPVRSSSRRKNMKTTIGSSGNFQWGDFDMDGCVHKISDESIRTLLGTSNRAPRWAVAHKFPPTAVVTELLNVEVQVGRTGALTPVAVLTPVDIGGVTVQRATMHNFPHMQQMLGGVERVLKGSTVMVRRAGDVIPQVVSRVSSIGTDDDLRGISDENFISLAMPSHCPACGSKAVFESEKNDTTASAASVGQILRCGGPPLLCPPRAVAALRHAYSRDAFDITGLSEARIQQLMDAGFLRMPSDLFAIANDAAKLEEIADLDGWGTKSAQNMATVAKRVASEGVTLSRLIYSLGIRLAGVHSSALIAAVYGNVDAFLADIDEAAIATNGMSGEENATGSFSRLEEDNDQTKGIGPILLSALRDFAAQKALVDAARQLAKSVKVLDDLTYNKTSESNDSLTSSSPTPLSGLSVVFTGSVNHFSRSAAQKLAKEMGAKSTPSTVSKTTGMVVAGDGGGKKRDQAEKLGVRIVDADEFLQMVDDFHGKR